MEGDTGACGVDEAGVARTFAKSKACRSRRPSTAGKAASSTLLAAKTASMQQASSEQWKARLESNLLKSLTLSRCCSACRRGV